MINFDGEAVDLYSPTAAQMGTAICARRMNAATYAAYVMQMRAQIARVAGAVPSGYPTGNPAEYSRLVSQFCPDLIGEGSNRMVLLWVGLGAAAVAVIDWWLRRR